MFKNTAEMINAMVDESRVFEYSDEDYTYVCKFDPECLIGKEPYSPFICCAKVSNMAESKGWIPLNHLWHKYADMREVFPAFPDLEVDTKVLVKETDSDTWEPHYFKEWNAQGEMVCHNGGKTSLTAGNKKPYWWRLWEVADGSHKGKTNVTSGEYK